MFYKVLNKFNGFLFRFPFEKIVDNFRLHYHEKKIRILKKQFKKVGNHFHIEPFYSIVNPQYISFGESFYALYNNRIEAIDQFRDQTFTPQIIIGNNVSMNTDCHLGCIDKIVIEDNVMIASRVFITDHFHGDTTNAYSHLPPREKPLVSKGPVLIKEGVWLGEGVVVLPGVTIGRKAIIGANSVVTRSIPDNAIAAGIPCQVIRIIE